METAHTHIHIMCSFPSSICVDVCVRFAKQQPAPRGNMAVHCGGPCSLSSCVYFMGVAPNQLGYNVIAFDQRGMGRSSPSL